MFFTDAEKALLAAPAPNFPMIAAASNAANRCGKCGHGGVDPRRMLRTAVCRYITNPEFIAHVKSLMPLPVSIAGVLVEDIR